MNEPQLSQPNTQPSQRYVFLDTLRGLTMLSMLLYHFLWDLVYIADFSIPWYHSIGAQIWQQSICQTFILLSGFCWAFGRHPLKRGLIVFWGGGLITLATMLVMPENLVMFGVLTLIGSCMILMIPFDIFFKKINKPAILILLTVLILAVFIWLHPDRSGYPQIPHGNLFTAYLGFPGDDFYSTDYFPLIPWFFLFVAGYLLHKISLKLNWLNASFFKKGLAPLSFIGRHSLLIYMLHQPVLYAVTMLILYLRK